MTTVCSVNPRFGFEAVDRYIGTAAGESKKVAVIGGGPGGMRTAQMCIRDRPFSKSATCGSASIPATASVPMSSISGQAQPPQAKPSANSSSANGRVRPS